MTSPKLTIRSFPPIEWAPRGIGPKTDIGRGADAPWSGPPIWGIGRDAILWHAERAVDRLWRGEVQSEAARVHQAAPGRSPRASCWTDHIKAGVMSTAQTGRTLLDLRWRPTHDLQVRHPQRNAPTGERSGWHWLCELLARPGCKTSREQPVINMKPLGHWVWMCPINLRPLLVIYFF